MIKPNGQPSGVFTISIDDGYVEWSFNMKVGANKNIAMVERKIRRALHCKKDHGKIRTPNSPNESSSTHSRWRQWWSATKRNK